MSEYIGMVEYRKGKGASHTRRLVSFEGRAKSMKKARKLFDGAANEQAMASEDVEVIIVSRLKDGAPVNTDIMGYKPSMTVILAPDYKPDIRSDKFDAVWEYADAKDVSPKPWGSKTTKAKARKALATPVRPDLAMPLNLDTMEKLADAYGVVKYDLINREVLENE
jgi:hypothetical protein